MSARTMRKLRGGDDLLLSGKRDDDDEDEEDDSNESEEDGDEDNARSSSVFCILPSDESSSSSEEEDEEEKERTNENLTYSNQSQTNTNEINSTNKKNKTKTEIQQPTEDDDEEEEDFEIILNEFKEKDKDETEKNGLFRSSNNNDCDLQQSPFHVLTKDLDVRTLNLDWSIRNSLAMGDTSSSSSTLSSRRGNSSRVFLFSVPAEGRRSQQQKRPPSYVGGGIGMTTYDDANPNYTAHQNNDLYRRAIPWPYSAITSPSDWYYFIHADSYRQELDDFHYIQNTGDPNLLPLFVTHHPFVTDALLHFATVLYETNQNEAGLTMLKRCLWVYECASLVRFQSALTRRYMDIDIPENHPFFAALRRLVHVSSIAGLWQSALSISQYLLALDPLRDPMNILAVLDSYALCCRSPTVYQWIIELVESNAIRIITTPNSSSYQNNSNATVESADIPSLGGSLIDLPNWSFSYALALFHSRGAAEQSDSQDATTTAKMALQKAIRTFPFWVKAILEAVQVDVSGRSCRMDWMPVLDQLEAQRAQNLNLHQGDLWISQAMLASEKIMKVYVHLSAKVWGENHDVLQFLYDNAAVVAGIREEEITVAANDEPTAAIPRLSSSLVRYSDLRFHEWETRIQQLPQDEANMILDPGLVAQAMVIEGNQNRPRLLRRMMQGDGNLPGLQGGGNHPPIGRRWAGPPTNIVDPDLPMMELFWRSFLPWNHVEGVRRDGGR